MHKEKPLSITLVTFLTCLLFIFMPVIVFNSLPQKYEYSKFIIFVGFVQIIWIITLAHQIKSKFKEVPIGNINALVLLFAAVVFLSDILGVDIKVSLMGSIYRYQGFITLICAIQLFFSILLCLQHSKAHKVLATLQYGLIISGTLVSVISLCQAFQFFILKDCSLLTYQGRIISTFGYPNFLAGYIVTIFPFLLNKSTSNNRKICILIFLLIIIFIMTILLAQSRAAILALIIISFIWIFSIKRSIFTILTILLTGIFSIYFISLTSMQAEKNLVLCGQPKQFSDIDKEAIYSIENVPEKVKAFVPQIPRQDIELSQSGWPVAQNIFGTLWQQIVTKKIIEKFFPQLGFLSRSSAWDTRTTFWIEGLNAVLKRPILGYGQENFELAIAPRRLIKIDNAHNIFLETAVASGLSGFIIFLLIIFNALRQAIFTVKLSLIAFLISAFFNPLSVAQVALFWLIIALSNHKIK